MAETKTKTRKNVLSIARPSKEGILAALKDSETTIDKKKRASLMERAFVAILYLSGARVSEICRNKRVPTRTEKITKDGWQVFKAGHTGHDWDSIRTHQLHIKSYPQSDGTEKHALQIENVHTEKTRNKLNLFRTIPINQDEPLVNIILKYANTFPEGLNAELFPFDRKRAHRILRKINPDWFPHFMRHTRCSHLAIDEGYSDLELQKITGWSDTRPAITYTHWSVSDIIKKHF